MPFPPPTTFLNNVCSNYKLSVPIARPCRPHTSYLMISPESVITRSPLVELSMYGKVLIATRGFISSLSMIRPLRRFVLGGARLYRVYLRTPVGLVVVFQRGRHLEKAKTSEHRPFHRRYNKPFASCLGVDAEWNSDGIHREKSGHGSNQSGEPFPVIMLDR